MRFDADLFAHIEQRAGGAARRRAGTDMLAEGDKQLIYLDPVAARQFAFEGFHSPFRRSRLDISPAVRDAMNVNIDPDARIIARYAHHEVGALGAHSFE